jgi:Fic family protein
MDESNWTMNWTDKYRLAPALPDPEDLGPLKELASDVITASARLEGAVPGATAQVIADKLRLLNSHFSNLIEGQHSFYPDIEKALARNYSGTDAEQYAQQLCAAHVQVEKELMQTVLAQPDINVSHPDFVSRLHQRFFSYLPPEHQFTHEKDGFTKLPVLPGTFRNARIGIQGPLGIMQIGPEAQELADTMRAFGTIFDPAKFLGGEEKILAAAAGHLKLAWLHPFRDGNGRTARLYSGFFMARCGINRANLWSLSRGFSNKKSHYMASLMSGDPQPRPGNRSAIEFMSENVALFCEHFLEVCKEQIDFMTQQLRLQTMTERIDRYAHRRSEVEKGFSPEAGRLLRAVFVNGELTRAEAYELLSNKGQKTAQRIIGRLTAEGLLESKNNRAPLTIGLPSHVLPSYFPNLYNIQTMGEEFMKRPERLAGRGA